MNRSSFDVELPGALLPFRKKIEATLQPFVEIKARPEKDLSLWQSKFAGLPYLPREVPYPLDAQGQAMALLAQLNFAEAPALEGFPERGILQFYLSHGDDLYGMCFEDLAKQSGFRILYFPTVVEDESTLITDFSFLPAFDRLPLQKSCSLTFRLQQAPISVYDYRFDSVILGQSLSPGEMSDELLDARGQYEKLFPSAGHKIGGYPYFTQYDPRASEEYRDQDYVLLFQMDTDGDAGIMWGDCGVGNFFIRLPDLQERDFSRVLYNWDCC